MKQFILKLIRFYQKYLSFDSGLLKNLTTAGSCRFHPTCSEYTYLAVERYGIILGLWMGFKRIIRCGPWSKGGDNPI